MEKELCKVCDAETGNAGIHDGSLFFDVGDGPYCDDCYDKESMKRLNKWIAEEVMGEAFCKHEYDKIHQGTVVSQWLCYKCGHVLNDWASVTRPSGELNIQPYTTDLNLALSAVVKHCKADYMIKLDYSKGRGVFDCALWDEDKRDEVIDTCHKNAATAACLGLYELITEKEWPNE